MEKLTGADYINQPYLVLRSHPDFSDHAMAIARVVGKMKTEQLEKIDLLKGAS